MLTCEHTKLAGRKLVRLTLQLSVSCTSLTSTTQLLPPPRHVSGIQVPPSGTSSSPSPTPSPPPPSPGAGQLYAALNLNETRAACPGFNATLLAFNNSELTYGKCGRAIRYLWLHCSSVSALLPRSSCLLRRTCAIGCRQWKLPSPLADASGSAPSPDPQFSQQLAAQLCADASAAASLLVEARSTGAERAQAGAAAVKQALQTGACSLRPALLAALDLVNPGLAPGNLDQTRT